MANPIDLDALEIALAKATPGPWEDCGRGGDGEDYRGFVQGPNNGWTIVRPGVNNDRAIEDAAAIVALRNAIDSMIAELRALREVAEAARAWDRAVEGDGRPDVARRDARRAIDRLDAVRGSR